MQVGGRWLDEFLSRFKPAAKGVNRALFDLAKRQLGPLGLCKIRWLSRYCEPAKAAPSLRALLE
jgi:hypothetical protein